MYSMWHGRVPQGAFARLERHAGKLARAVLRGLGGSNPARLPGHGETCRKVTRPDPTHSCFSCHARHSLGRASDAMAMGTDWASG